MKRVSIRNTQSEKDVKPRMFDALIDDEGHVFIECKHARRKTESIPLAEVMRQIAIAKGTK